jgi:hypothetical protein
MKKIILATAAAAAFGLSAAASATDCTAGTLCEVTGDSAEYITEDFNLQLSPGVALEYVQSANAVGVGTFHSKGNSGFAGTSAGGQIIACGVAADGAAPVMPTVVSSGSGATGC